MSKGAPLKAGIEPYPGYVLRKQLGAGGFGEVWEAEVDNKRVALKFLPCDDTLNASEENRSIQIVRQLKHPNLLRIDNVWCYPGYLVIAMELADGTLLDLFQAYITEFGTPILPEHLCLFLAQAAAALDFMNAHQHKINDQRVGVQHCDIKPSNLLLFGEKIKLSDFSLTSVTTSAVKNHRRAGTADYLAPEVFQGRLSDRTDQYALAVSYVMLRSGRFPFGETPDPLPRGYQRPTPDLTMLSEVERPIIARGLATLPIDRWPSCGEMIATLQSEIKKHPEIVHAQPKAAESPAFRQADRADRRNSTRHNCSLRTSWRLLGDRDQSVWRAIINDISSTGVGLLSDSNFKRGTILVVKFEDGGLNRPVLVRVVRSIKQAERWLLGCTFASKLTEDELQGLLHSPALA